MARHAKKPLKGSLLLERLQQDIRSLNSSILVITQKMKYVVRNEKVLGRNLIVLNKKLKGLEEKLLAGQFASKSGSSEVDVSNLRQKLEESDQRFVELEARLSQLSENAASKEEVQEMHYVVDSINPLQFVTLEQVKGLVAGKSVRSRKKKN